MRPTVHFAPRWIHFALGVALLVGLFVPAVARAQGSAVMNGTVTSSASKKPIADVVVTVTSPALQGEQTVVTDKSGAYRIPNLPPGTYTLRAEADSYKPYARGNITLRIDSTIRINFEMLPQSIGSTAAAQGTTGTTKTTAQKSKKKSKKSRVVESGAGSADTKTQ